MTDEERGLPDRLQKADWIHGLYARGLLAQETAELLLEIWTKYDPEFSE